MPKCGSATAQVVCLLGTTNESNTARLVGRMHGHVYCKQGHPSSLAPSTSESATVLPTGTLIVTNMGLLFFSATRSTTQRAISRRRLATVTEQRRRVVVPQTAIEKIVQKYAVGLPDGKQVKAGDYVMIRPEHVMTHDNTGPVISKFVGPCPTMPSPPQFYTIQLSWTTDPV